MQGSSSGELPNWALNLTILTEYINTLLPKERDILFDKLGIKSIRDLESLFLSQNEMHVEPYEEQLMNITEYWLSKHLRLIVPPILIVIGTIGNILSCIILLRRQMARISTYVYLGALAIVDTFVLYMGLFRIWLGEVADFNIMGKHDAICKIFMLLGYTASDFSVWIIVAVTVERYIAVCFPLQANVMCNTKRALFVILAILAVILTINLHFLWTVKVVEFKEFGEHVKKCTGGERYQDFIRIWPWVDAFIYSFLPFILIMSLNFLIIRQVFLAHRDREQFLSNDSQRRTTSQDTGYKITVMLLSISFTFLLTTLPMVICMIIGAILQSDTDLKVIAQISLASTITEYLMYINHSMNFFLYCATGQKFRQQLSRLACWKTEMNQYRSQMVSESMTVNGGTYNCTYRSRNADQTEMIDVNNRSGKQCLLNRTVT
ncbi:FMRFamide receptor-like [Lineus longissimus]|uniref:FMRFamide receptor-like n=1 Tax=Lineus longissimus TaxID=88925 RepID=UPI002B4C94CE